MRRTDLIKRDALGVLDVLLLLAVTGRLLEGLDDEGRGGGNDGDGGLTVLDGQLDSDPLLMSLDRAQSHRWNQTYQTLPVAGSLGDIFSDLCEDCQYFISVAFNRCRG